jgi:hypothetical protein
MPTLPMELCFGLEVLPSSNQAHLWSNFFSSESRKSSSGSHKTSSIVSSDALEEEELSSLSCTCCLFIAAVDSSCASSLYLCLLSLEAIIVEPTLLFELRRREWSIVDEKRTTALIYIPSSTTHSNRHIDYDGVRRSTNKFEEMNASDYGYVGLLAHGPYHSSHG